jgi:hypothetical protein
MKKLLASAGALLLAIALSLPALAQQQSPAIAGQNLVVPQVPTVGTGDLFQDVTGGVPQAPAYYATAAQIAGVPGYVNGGAVLTGWSFTFANTQTSYFIQPAGTLAAGTITAAPNPSDGQRECFLSTQTSTGITWTANTGQSLSNAPTAGVAMVPACMTYSKATATWYRSP